MCFYTFLNFERNVARNGSKNRKTSFLNVSWNSVLYPSQGLSFFIFFKQVELVAPYPTSHFFSRPLKICLRYCYVMSNLYNVK
jgi:hypothetical protein